ncbi:hypothetical protein [Amycolatopsis nigrescens]|uniref:hypothetical protein n=1 Tax=Amycolatopsis nigrescens TaxID=381445 RepID=UPI00037EB4DD|nr:hypothetical protein [Amycolatopsis nigrescens]
MAGSPEEFEPCAEWDNGPIDEDVAETVKEFARWLNYLAHPERHGGPRRYVCAECGFELDSIKKRTENELGAVIHSAGNMKMNHTSLEWELRSVITGFDPSNAFYAIHEVSGIRWRGSMEECFTALKDSYLCSAEGKKRPADSHLYKHDYSFDEAFAKNLDALLAGIEQDDPRYEAAKSYHDQVKRYAESHENQMFALAETLGRYRGAYLGSRDLILQRMRKMVEIFKQKANPEPADTSWDGILEVMVSLALTAAFSAVPVAGGVAARVAYGVITGAISSIIVGELETDEAGKSYKAEGPNSPPTWENTWTELVDWFVIEADRISNELFISIEPRTEAYGTLSQLMRDQLWAIMTETDTNKPPALPAFVPPA